MLEGTYRCQAIPVAGVQYLAVVVDFRLVEVALSRLDTRPFNGETIAVETHTGEQTDIALEQLVVVDGTTSDVDAARVGGAFEGGPIAVDITALDLMSGCRGAQEKGPRQVDWHDRTTFWTLL